MGRVVAHALMRAPRFTPHVAEVFDGPLSSHAIKVTRLQNRKLLQLNGLDSASLVCFALQGTKKAGWIAGLPPGLAAVRAARKPKRFKRPK